MLKSGVRRQALGVLVALSVGCSQDERPIAVPVHPIKKSFVEAEAIWKDEVAKLLAMEADYQKQEELYDKALLGGRADKELGNERTGSFTPTTVWNEFRERQLPLMEEQKRKVQEAYDAKEAAKH